MTLFNLFFKIVGIQFNFVSVQKFLKQKIQSMFLIKIKDCINYTSYNSLTCVSIPVIILVLPFQSYNFQPTLPFQSYNQHYQSSQPWFLIQSQNLRCHSSRVTYVTTPVRKSGPMFLLQSLGTEKKFWIFIPTTNSVQLCTDLQILYSFLYLYNSLQQLAILDQMEELINGR